ncbi:hypothetical protein [Streptomyces sp. 8N706]|uniref:hypothetical protein n=1 Tax=Streptomyces sp. 8N706 TaxID=3457416 RepID=UPI003FD22F7D
MNIDHLDDIGDIGATHGDFVIDVTGLRRSYQGGFEAVRGISFSVAHGERTVWRWPHLYGPRCPAVRP